MDTTKPTSLSSPAAPVNACSAATLTALLRLNSAPLVIDVRKHEAFTTSEYTLPGALRRDPLTLETWADTLPTASTVLVYCVHGHEVSQNVASALGQQGVHASFLQGGIEAWRELGLPLTPKPAGNATRWVTRERPKIDRIACPWLVRRFVDAGAEFLYVPSSEVRVVAQTRQAMAYDVNAKVADTPLTHEGELCSFDAFIKIYRLGADKALALLATIVRGADTDRLDLAPQAAGLLAVSLGMSRRINDDLAMLDAMMPVYDALYAWCRDSVAGTDQKHNWKPA